MVEKKKEEAEMGQEMAEWWKQRHGGSGRNGRNSRVHTCFVDPEDTSLHEWS